MAFARVPGTTCVTQQQPIDFRTSQLAAAPPQGPVGADVYDSRFDANEIQSLEMFEASLKHRSLEELQYLRAKTEYLYEDAVRAYGAQSRAAAFAAASVAVVDNQIGRSEEHTSELQSRVDISY